MARYVVNTYPTTSIVEEILPVVVPVYGGERSVLSGQMTSLAGEGVRFTFSPSPALRDMLDLTPHATWIIIPEEIPKFFRGGKP